jgi:hypothetical protein
VAKSRDDHYHNPPDYLVLEPEDTTARTRNLQQTNTNGYKFQGTPEQFKGAEALVLKWGANGKTYLPTITYQKMLRELLEKYPYRLDTNFAKMDRIVHPEIEAFKERVYCTKFHGHTIGAWNRLLSKGDDDLIRRELSERFDIRDEGQPIIE